MQLNGVNDLKISKSEANYIKEQIDNIDNSIRFYNKSSHRLFMGTVISELFILALFIFFVCSGVYPIGQISLVK